MEAAVVVGVSLLVGLSLGAVLIATTRAVTNRSLARPSRCPAVGSEPSTGRIPLMVADPLTMRSYFRFAIALSCASFSASHVGQWTPRLMPYPIFVAATLAG